MTSIALAVVENGHATMAIGALSAAEMGAHFSKFDLIMGVHHREYEMLRTGTLLEKMELTGVQVYKKYPPDNTMRFYTKELELEFPTKARMVRETLVNFLKSYGYTISQVNDPLSVRHLEVMVPRTGYIKGLGGS